MLTIVKIRLSISSGNISFFMDYNKKPIFWSTNSVKYVVYFCCIDKARQSNYVHCIMFDKTKLRYIVTWKEGRFCRVLVELTVLISYWMNEGGEP